MRLKHNVVATGTALRRMRKKIGRTLTPRRVLLGTGAVVLGTSLAFTASYFWPRSVQFSYAGDTCFANPVILPKLSTPQPSKSFTAELIPSASIAGYPLFSATTCITPTAPPPENTQEHLGVAPFNNAIFKKDITLSTNQTPSVTAKLQSERPLPVKEPLTFALSEADSTFDYKLKVNDQTIDCPQEDMQIKCSLDDFGLNQSTPYDFSLVREFDGEPTDIVFKKTMTTIEALSVVSATIMPGQKVFGVPENMVLTLNKPVTKLDDVTVMSVATDGQRQNLPITHNLQDGKVVVSFTQPLPRSITIELRIGDMQSADGAYIPTAYVLPFNMSGGPQVAGVSVPQYKVPVNANIVLTFDSTLGANQPYSKFIQLSTPAGPVGASVTARGNVATIVPNAPLPACTPFTIKVVDGIQSDVGVTGGSAWQYNSRTLCQTVFSIGASVQGRAIMAYRFGSGPSRMVLVGALHGNEKNSTYTLRSLIDYLESHPDKIPANRTVTIIPVANPDGFAANSRFNARNVDLNRNFGANNWKSSVTVPGGTFPQGGGTSPMSEPESQALARYTLSQSPRLVLSYHSVGPLAAANEAGDSHGLASTYGKLARIPSYGNDANSNFDYDTTGAYDDWLHDKYGIPSILIELSSHYGNDFYRHRDAIITMLQIP